MTTISFQGLSKLARVLGGEDLLQGDEGLLIVFFLTKAIKLAHPLFN